MPEVLKAADILKEQGISAEVVSFHTVKPLDVDCLQKAAARFKLLVTVEEHGLIGGLGSAVAEWRASANSVTPLMSFGTPDEFMHEVGTQEYALAKYGLTAENIAERILASVRKA